MNPSSQKNKWGAGERGWAWRSSGLLIKDHTGYIDVDSQPGKGTTFTLYFPLNRDTLAHQPDAAIPPEQYRGGGESVLVVDDVREQRDIAARTLEKLGYRVACVPSGEAAVAYLREQSAEILLLDMIMPPGIDGLETYRRVKERVPAQKAVIASGFSETAKVAEAQRIGAGPYIKKPYSFEQIGLAVREALDQGSDQCNPMNLKSPLPLQLTAVACDNV